MGMRFGWMGVVLAAAWIAVSAAPALARPANLKALGDYYGPFLPAPVNNCSTCHLPSSVRAPATLTEFPHNPYGRRLAALAGELAAAGKRADIASRAQAAEAEDSDGDGVPNGLELLAGRRPGDAKDRPTSAELAAARKMAVRFDRYRNTYRWRPFEPVRRPPVPKVRNAAWVRNPIDAFIAAEHEKRGLKPRPEASPVVLLRRVYLDLTGLSPTPEEVRSFLAECAAENHGDTETRSAARSGRGRERESGRERPAGRAEAPSPNARVPAERVDRRPNAQGPTPNAQRPMPDAYERVVDRLLASPQYGERWGRHWMDVWRYSDWTGYGAQVRDSQPHIWRWRDWIVDSLNRDKPYDRMVQEMLAADELAPEDPNALRATGYLVRNYKLLSREKWMQDVVDHTGQAFLGLTVGCARCHDHMYDPITQKEYYQLRAVFEPHQVRTDWVPGEFDTKKDGLARAFDSQPDAPTFLYVRGDERQPVKGSPLTPGIPLSLGGRLEIRPVQLPLLARVPEKQSHVIAAARAAATERVEAAQRTLASCADPQSAALPRLRLDAAETARDALEAVLVVETLEDAGKRGSADWTSAATAAAEAQRKQALAEATVARQEAAAALEKAHAGSAKADALAKLQETLKTVEAAVAKAEAELKAPETTAYKPRVTSSYPTTSTGRRLALARWLTASENPLTARVAVNHIWMRHFGQGIVPTVSDFGRNGSPPSHPELLDWLAAEFMNTGSNEAWGMKRLHRLIVTSSTYRMASTADPADLAKDPDNRYVWRMNSRRMDAEIVRDNVLYVAGQLDPKLGGPDIDQNLGLTVKRRSLYFRSAPEKEMVFLGLFDGPNPLECYRRRETVVPQQALALANSELTLVQSRLLARTLAAEAGTDGPKFIQAAFLRVLARRATPAETRECLSFLEEQARRLPASPPAGASAPPADGSKPATDPALRARENLVLVLLNHNEFITIR